MTTCPICKKDITEPIKQFGDVPLCLSCFLSGDSWIGDDPQVLALLKDGMALDDAMAVVNKERHITFSELFEDLLKDVNIVRVVTK
jgi:hypothetical protein